MLYQTSALLNRSPITLVWFERKQLKEYVKNDTENSHTLKIKLLCLTFEYSCDWIQIAVKQKLHNYFYDWTLLTFSNTQVLVLISNQFTLYAFVIANAFKMLSSLTQMKLCSRAFDMTKVSSVNPLGSDLTLEYLKVSVCNVNLHIA